MAKTRETSLAASRQTTRSDKGKGKANTNEKNPEVLPESKSRKRHRASYEAIIAGKVATCECMVDYRSLGKVVPVHRIVKLGLEFFFQKVDGYILSLCREFYSDLREVDGDLRILRMTMKGQIIQVHLIQ
ncbi:unnamed protein product, partial [Ilex paraguariensis]